MKRRKLPLGGSLGSYNITNPLNGQVNTTQIQPNLADPYYSSNSLNNLSTPQPRQQNFFQSQGGQAAGQAANIFANAIPAGERPNFTQSEKDTDAQGTAIASSIGPWWGALAKVGTSASAGIRGDDRGSHARGWLGATANPFHQFDSLKNGQSREKVTSFLNPIASAHYAADRKKKTADTNALMADLAAQKSSDSILANYPVYGVGKFGMKLPNGGKLPYPTQNNADVDVLASNVGQYNGPTHEGGGIPIDTNMDQSPDAEIENKEVVKDDMVLSNRLSPSKDAKKAANGIGISSKKRETYASLAARIGAKKGELESNMSSTNTPAANSARIMSERMDNMMDMLFMDQQVKKFPSVNGKKFPGGGRLPLIPGQPTNNTVAGPLYAQQDPRLGIDQNRQRAIDNLNNAQQFKNIVSPAGLVSSADLQTYQNKFVGGALSLNQPAGGGARNYTRVDPRLLQQADSVIAAGRPFIQPQQPLATRAKGGTLPTISKSYIVDPITGESNRFAYTPDPNYQAPLATPSTAPLGASVRNPLNTYTPSVAKPAQVQVPQGSESPFRKTDWQDYRGDLAAVVGTAANQMIINRMETNYNPETADAPLNTYTDRTNYLTSSAEQQFNAASRGINNSSSQDNLALKSNLYAKHLQGLNQSLDSEFQRKDNNTNRFNELVNRSNIINANTRNQGKFISMQNRNEKRALTQANVNNLLQSYIGNQATRDFKQSEYAANYLNSLKSGNRGVSERIINNLPAKVKRELGFK